MPVLVQASWDRSTDKVRLRFPYDPQTLELVKTIPGRQWDASTKTWLTSPSALPALERAGVKLLVQETPARFAELPPQISGRLRPYQLEGAQFLVSRRGALLTFEQRVGKTPTTIAAACALMQAGHIDSALVLYPAGVLGEWRSQLKRWANVNLHSLEGQDMLSMEDCSPLNKQPFLFVGCHYEILDFHEHDLHMIFQGRRYAVIADEVQYVQNRKIGRTKVAWSLAHANGTYKPVSADEESPGLNPAGYCMATWGLTGTPMRNFPKNLWSIFELIHKGGAGTYWQFAQRYADAHRGDFGWVDKGSSNEEELALRLAAISYRKTRAEVAPWLPKTDRKLVVCAVPESKLKEYRKLERTLGASAAKGLGESEDIGGSQEEAVRELVKATSLAKIPHALERVHQHTQQGKVLVFAHFHETLKQLDEAFDTYAASRAEKGEVVPPHFTAGGWVTPAKRRELIDAWKQCPGPSILLANTKSSGTGIDLSDAWVAVFLELEWVPADFRQAEDRIVAVHDSRRTVPPLLEYLLVRDTIDEAMGRAMVGKMRIIQRVVGKDAEGSALTGALNDGGLVQATAFGLSDTSDTAVRAALDSLRAKLMGETEPSAEVDNYATAGVFEDSWDEDETTQDDSED